MGPTRNGVPKVVSALVPVLSGSRVLVDERLERRGVGDLGLASAPDDDRLEVLRAEHGADAAPPRHALAVLPVVGHRREPHAMLARRADRDRVDVGALGVDQRLHRFARRLAPEMPAPASPSPPVSVTSR